MTTKSCIIRGVCSSGRSAVQILVKSTIIKGLTNKSNPDTINTINTNKGQ